jgi:hypothetical protein
MAGRLIFHSKFLYRDGAIREMILWELPARVKGIPHRFKYRLFYGLPDGTPVIRYDNERGKGDHRHVGSEEGPYRFAGVEKLVEDFLKDIERWRRKKGKTDGPYPN